MDASVGLIGRQTAPSVKSVRALERGLDVLEMLQSGGGATLEELRKSTGIPKATLLRVLKTLMSRGLVWRRLADRAFLASSRIVCAPTDEVTRLVEAASGVMSGLCEQVSWPSVLAVRSGGQMEIVETNRPRSRLSHIPLGPIGARVSMLMTASGRAYFAFCDEEERGEILDILKSGAGPEEVFARDQVWVARMVAETQAQGYASRDPLLGGDGRSSISLPIALSGRVIAAMNLTWTRRAAPTADILTHHLGALRGAVAEVVRRLETPSRN
jgi:IclR family mhp operon transcriptional activator